ncbi:amidophosphoribosyltransferase [Usitatibacter palustris]|uniref:Amidophosphoribosyltransferase n=1 Tax=Usitatibacter palustris TaxID=2732487 RepID=A0A6M4H7L5_9PROT|nr:amidophosphoribosyltransferase [Usitatibacter palustris]QJR14683.1 Amidophosphoribosyltransferase [Usitatibacter palustris]
MCAIIGVVARSPVNQIIYDGLTVLQHRGQDAAGLVTAEGHSFHMHKGGGLVRDVFRTRDMRNLVGHMGIGHCRYPTAGSASSVAESQPFYVNSPFGITLGHNGNLVNSDQLRNELFAEDRRHVNTNSDSEVLLNVLAHEITDASQGSPRLDPDMIFKAVSGVHRRVKGAYAVVAMIAGYGLLAFRDPFGIRPLIIGRADTEKGVEFMVASESVALDTMNFKVMRDVAPGEAILIDESGNFHARICAEKTQLNPCIFEYVYLARPDSVIDGISVYESRRNMGKSLADKIKSLGLRDEIDVVIPIPDSSRPSALEVAAKLKKPYREGFIKNRYIGRTFIMPGQELRRRSVRQKLNAMAIEFRGKNVLLVDDSIVRGTTSREIVSMARESGANKVFFASAAPPVRFPNVYGIDMPSRAELIANGRDEAQIAEAIGADAVIYQELDALIEAVRTCNPAIERFDCSCFDGNYITGDVSESYLASIEASRADGESQTRLSSYQLDLGLSTVD